MKNNTVLVLKTVNANMTSAYDSSFVYPRQGMVSCPDWDPAPVCGHGLHGFLRGTGDGYLASWDSDAIWLVIRVSTDDIVDLGDKVKFRCGEVIFAGDRKAATDMLKAAYPDAPVIGCISVVGDRSTATAGQYGTATAGYGGTATAGHSGTATAGHNGTATAGQYGTATAGHSGTATACHNGTATAGDRGTATAGGEYGTATAGDYGTATAGKRGTATAGHNGTATAGDYGTATAGDCGTAIAGDCGTATTGHHGTATVGDNGIATAGEGGIASAGKKGEIHIRWLEHANNRYRTAIGYVGEDGILPNVPYHVIDGKLVRKL